MSANTQRVRQLVKEGQEQLADAQEKLALAAKLMVDGGGPVLVVGEGPAEDGFGDFRLGKRSLERLEGVHPDIMAVVQYAIRVSRIDFGITRTGGVRDIETQRKLMGAGASKTLRSRHLTGHAVDIAPLDPKTGKYSKKSEHALAIHSAFVRASVFLDVPLRYGGDWDMDGQLREEGESDLVHHELPRRDYGNNKHSQSEKAAAFLASIASGVSA